MKPITEMVRDEILALNPESVTWRLKPAEVLHIGRQLDAFWEYNYEAAQNGKPGYHALLKSDLHSHAFFASRFMLKPENIRRLMAMQMVSILKSFLPKPDYICGIPDGATLLGEAVAKVWGCEVAKMEKVSGHLLMTDRLPPDCLVLLVEDLCTKGTGFKEAVHTLKATNPKARLCYVDPVIINRGGLEHVLVTGFGKFEVIPIVELRIEEWPADDCKLCRANSIPIKPKLTDENWRLITTSQL